MQFCADPGSLFLGLLTLGMEDPDPKIPYNQILALGSNILGAFNGVTHKHTCAPRTCECAGSFYIDQ